MLLAVNIGNTHTVIGVFSGTELTLKRRIATDPRRTPDEYGALLETLFSLDHLETRALSDMIVCSVVPVAEISLRQCARDRWNLEPVHVSADLDLGIGMRYLTPERLGADRLANAVAARALVGYPAIIADLGTATTIDVLDAEGAFLGGAISAGLELSARALAERTAQLPNTSLSAPPSVIGFDTMSALQSGLVYGHAAMVDGLVERMLEELGPDTAVIATGGLARAVTPYLRVPHRTEENLTLEGLRLLHSRNRKNA